jgi:hypothetical protein
MKEKYKTTLDSLGPVAVKDNQTEVYAPNHDNWRTVACVTCGEQFHIGWNRIYGSRITEQEAVKQLESLLAQDHRNQQPHSNSFELAD